MIINKGITEAIEVLKSFDKQNQMYWIDKMSLCNSEKGFIMIYLGLCKTL